MLVANATVETVEADRPILVDGGRVTIGTSIVRYSVGALSITIDFEFLASLMLGIADSMFQVFDVTFKGGGTMRDAVNHKVAAALRVIDETALNTLADYFTELAFRGVAMAAEEFAEEAFKRPPTKSELKVLRSMSRQVAHDLLASRIPSVGRGGATRTEASIPEATLVAFYDRVERVYPFWRDVAERVKRGDDTWRSDAKQLPEYRRFKNPEKRHADAVLAMLGHGRKVNGARPAPRVLAREHARLIVGADGASDAKLRKLESKGKRLATPV